MDVYPLAALPTLPTTRSPVCPLYLDQRVFDALHRRTLRAAALALLPIMSPILDTSADSTNRTTVLPPFQMVFQLLHHFPLSDAFFSLTGFDGLELSLSPLKLGPPPFLGHLVCFCHQPVLLLLLPLPASPFPLGITCLRLLSPLCLATHPLG